MTTPTQPQTGADVMAQFIPSSPFVAKLGIVADALDTDEVRLRLPWDPTNVTIADMVHGGAIAALADVAVMAAAWAGAEVPDSLRGVTTSMSIQFLAPARATDLIAIGRVLRRGKTLVNCDVDVSNAGWRSRREGDRHLQGGLSTSSGVMTARPRILLSCNRR
jgi:uncharacterized protein (TIGR00369 family)